MKKLIIILFTTFMLTSSVYADETCKTISSIAETIMKARQDNISLSFLIDWANGLENKTEEQKEVNELIKRIIIKAYDSPHYTTAEYKHNAIVSFSNEIMLDCMKKHYLNNMEYK